MTRVWFANLSYADARALAAWWNDWACTHNWKYLKQGLREAMFTIERVGRRYNVIREDLPLPKEELV